MILETIKCEWGGHKLNHIPQENMDLKETLLKSVQNGHESFEREEPQKAWNACSENVGKKYQKV